MKSGIMRRIDDLGRIVIPKEIRKTLCIREGDPLELSVDGDKIILELYLPTYDYEERIKRLIKALEQDEFLQEEREKAIEALKEVCKIFSTTEKRSNT